MARRTIRINTADGQGHVMEYETDIQGLDDDALENEVMANLQEVSHWVLPTLPDGTTAEFMSEVTAVFFLTAQPEES